MTMIKYLSVIKRFMSCGLPTADHSQLFANVLLTYNFSYRLLTTSSHEKTVSFITDISTEVILFLLTIATLFYCFCFISASVVGEHNRNIIELSRC